MKRNSEKPWAMFPFAEWEMPWDFDIYTGWGATGSTCGSSALAMVTRENPWDLEAEAKRNRLKPFEPLDIRRVLKKRGFESHHFDGVQSLVNLGHDADWACDHLNKDHCLIFSADTTKEEASWFVFYGNAVYHNGKQFSTSPLFGLTNPMIDCILIRRKNKR